MSTARERWIATYVAVERPLVIFLGEDGRYRATVFRGVMHDQLCLALRGLEHPGCRPQVMREIRVKVPHKFQVFNNTGQNRRFMLLQPAGMAETVLEFERPIPRSLELTLKRALERRYRDEERIGTAESDGEGQSLPRDEGQPREGKRGVDRERPGQLDEPQGQRLTPEPAQHTQEPEGTARPERRRWPSPRAFRRNGKRGQRR